MTILNNTFSKVSSEKQIRFHELQILHETERQRIIAEEGEVSPYDEYPELDRLASEMFYILSGGAETIEISCDEIIANAEQPS